MDYKLTDVLLKGDSESENRKVVGILLDSLESEVLETIYSLPDLSKWGESGHAWIRLCIAATNADTQNKRILTTEAR